VSRQRDIAVYPPERAQRRTPPSRRTEILVGCITAAIGIAGMAGVIPPIRDFTYPIVWWGLLLILDVSNERRSGESLWHGRVRHFVLITLPLSVIYWMLYELLNLAMPQWRYSGGIRNLNAQVLFGFAAFSTVIPIVMECYWLVGGGSIVPSSLSQVARNYRLWFVLAGAALLTLPLYSPFFWINQLMWLGIAIMLLPFVPGGLSMAAGRFARAVFFGSILSGLLWECANYWAHTRWEYMIQLDEPHLFEMPMAGYFGFVPFGLSTVVLYIWQRRIHPRLAISAVLFIAAFALLYGLTGVYVERSLWVTK
jgi:hypothetical protein